MTQGSGDASGPVVRRVRAEEWREVRRVRLTALELAPGAFGSTLAREREFGEEVWQERTGAGATSTVTSMWVAADAEGRILGTASAMDLEGKIAILGMWVQADQRAQGLGGRLLDAALRWSGETHPGERIWLEVNPAQASAVRLYLSRGFAFTGLDRDIGHLPGVRVREMVRSDGPTSAPSPHRPA